MEQLLESYSGTGTFTSRVYTTRRSAQTFTIGSSGENGKWALKRVVLLLFRSGNAGTVTVRLQTTTNGVPNEVFLSTAKFDGNLVTTNTDGEMYSIDMPYYEMQPGQKYAIVLSGTGTDFGNSIVWKLDVSGTTYTGGNVLTSASGTNWSVSAAADFIFSVYGTKWAKRGHGSTFGGRLRAMRQAGKVL